MSNFATKSFCLKQEPSEIVYVKVCLELLEITTVYVEKSGLKPLVGSEGAEWSLINYIGW